MLGIARRAGRGCLEGLTCGDDGHPAVRRIEGGGRAMTAAVETLRALADEARGLAARELGRPRLCSVQTEFAEGAWVGGPREIRFGFQELRRRLALGTTLKACDVALQIAPRSLRIVSASSFGRRQVEELSAIPGAAFPPPTLELAGLRLEISDVLDVLRRNPVLGTAMGTLSLGLCVHDGRLAWRALQEVPRVGFRTLVLDAGAGHVLYEKVDRWQEPVRPTQGT
jgi:hypothetical protein